MITLPKTKSYIKLFARIQKEGGKILGGKMIAIDPASSSSSHTGYAIFNKGKFEEKGVIKVSTLPPLHQRLWDIYDELQNKYNHFDVFVIEDLKGMHNDSLKYAVGAIITAVRVAPIIFIPPKVWRALISDDYEKSDENDAEMLGRAAIVIAKGV
jgi:hypothetical protein